MGSCVCVFVCVCVGELCESGQVEHERLRLLDWGSASADALFSSAAAVSEDVMRWRFDSGGYTVL